ncbi:MAG: autotransporter outer membrane beta-barrel domain-containing protein [Proteobacteria bacterium]|nr:autotransporter outer membrane beta-barrel domain-containing protein [Pseudomonadota bacterium]
MRKTGDDRANTRARKVKAAGASRGRRHALLCAAAGVAIAAAVPATPALALSGVIAGMTATVVIPAVGQTIINPATGQSETVVQKLNNGTVLTDHNNSIIVASTVGDTFTDNGLTYTVTAVTTNGFGGAVDTVVLTDNQSPPVVSAPIARVADQTAALTLPPATSGGNSGTNLNPVIPAGNNVYSDQRRGGDGGNGHAGGGVSVCIPVIGCATIAYDPSPGDPGGPGPTINTTLTGDYSSIITSNKLPAISIVSVGGNGGNGGAAVGIGVKGASGGSGGVGGDVTLNASGNLATAGIESHGIFVQSRAGQGGTGGSGYLASPGGAGGTAAQGGNVNVTFSGTISTSGTGAMGILAQSLGGSAGGGGSSFGIVGDAGSGNIGGNGGSATVTQSGQIHTFGKDAHGVLAQSIGGTGGNAGTSGGIVTFGNGAGTAGGNGGSATVHATNGSVTTTAGDGAFGLFAQSVGGGGGNGGTSIGLVALGSSGGAGGNGGSAAVTVDAGATVSTSGIGSVALFAQSVGGGGGTGGVSGGLVALGGTGSGGGDGGTVSIDSTGLISTTGVDSRGIFAESIGGGGGNASGVGGLVALGASGGGGGIGGTVTITTHSGGQVITTSNGADAIFAQSIGGGGGAGSNTGGLFALGGNGTGGGAGGAVTVTNGGLVQTTGDRARGVFAQSVGGGGGTGGDGGGLVVIGGRGGSASNGGLVTVSNTGEIDTHGNVSSAIQAQSVGGGGGDGGTTGGVLLTIGGKGGFGGDGGNVTINDSGFLSTHGNDSHGIFAQSIGEGGGNGGSTVSVSAFAGVAIGGAGDHGGKGGTVDVELSKQTITVGGSTVQVDPQIVTSGDRSRGIFEQSIGGGGGNGGFAVQVSGGYVFAASVAIGGSGAGGGNGGNVTLNGGVSILTQGANSEGIFAQSVGGGGGSGGFAVSVAAAGGAAGAGTIGVGIGGSGSGGGDGGTVTVNSGGAITTEGEFSTGLVAQSLGGGGGNGGFAVTVSGSGSGGGSISLGVGVGGSGAGGGNGGTVDATFDGTITTTADDAKGAIIQSVGGGGGNGGFNVTAAVSISATGGGGASVGVGGTGGGGGVGGSVTGNIGGLVQTSGDRSTGVVVQSLGGGGGNGGFNVSGSVGGGATVGGALSVGVGGAGGDGGAGGEVTASTVSIHTTGDQSGGLLAQSVGGGGGNGGFNVSGAISGSQTGAGAAAIGVGGAGGDGGAAGKVTATVTGNVTTEGKDSDAIVAQSVGGGGGNGAFNVSGAIAVSGSNAFSVGVGVGGMGGGGGASGEVDLNVTGLTTTLGKDSEAIIAQSLGGGGGNGGFNVTGNITLAEDGAGNVGVSVGGLGGGGGSAGAVNLNVNHGVADAGNTLVAATTTGDGAHGIIAQSIGGGGGNGGFSVSGGFALANSGGGNIGVGVGGAGGTASDGGTVVANVNGDVTTQGKDAGGIIAQSVGGGGGTGGWNVTGGIAAGQGLAGNILVGVGGFGGAGGKGGAVSGTVVSDVTTQGDNAWGITFQSQGGTGGSGGFNVTGGVALSIADGGGSGNLGVGIGGFGGHGGDASTVNANITGDVTTHGADAHAILLQSVGGGGGNGAFNVTGGVTGSSGVSGSIGFGLGGFGGGAGNGGDVTGVLNGDIWTGGAGSYGALLQSTGGAGGAGAFNVTGSVAFTVSNSAAAAVSLGVGGFGGDGGNAGKVNATVNGLYVTTGKGADAVTAQSVGGAGGSGGLNVSGAVSFSLGSNGTGSVGIGGFGGTGGNAGDVTLVRVGDTYTFAADSDGVTAQSLGGGGGKGGINIAGGLSITTEGAAGSVGIGIGGFGGTGGDAGNVVAHVTGNVHASIPLTSAAVLNGVFPGLSSVRFLPQGSNGVVAQSVGGGGGAGGINVTGNLSLTKPGGDPGTRVASIGIGGFGGGGGDAGTVNLTIDSPNANRVQVSSIGDFKNAVTAQSIGGDGGTGGVNISGGVASDGQLNVGIGGFGGGGGLGKLVTANVDADLFATGAFSNGLLAQSVGGGGGNGGLNVAGGLSFDTTNKEPTVTFGMGGFGGAGDRSGDVNVVQHGQIMIDGQLANAILVQSIAGGGGNGGGNIAAAGTLGQNAWSAAIGVGGTGGSGADAGNASLVSNGLILVNARPTVNPGPNDDPFSATAYTGNSTAIEVQSVGGGGGVGGFSVTISVAPKGNPFALGVGGTGGDAGNAGTVTLIRGYLNPGTASETADPSLIRTFGNGSKGIVAQSLGGGGGDAGVNLTLAATKGDQPLAALISVGGSGGGSGDGNTVNVRDNGDIFTTGSASGGIFAQSVGGGGGNANYNLGAGLLIGAKSVDLAVGGGVGQGGKGGDVTVNHKGTISTNGNNSGAITAQSIGGGGGNTSFDFAIGALADSSLDITIGRQGGAGGTSGKVTVISDGLLSTNGYQSDGIFAESVGGGGGKSSAIMVGGTLGNGASGDAAENVQGNIAVGLDGGTGAVAGDVSVTAHNWIQTTGQSSRGIFAQSIGGGGGAGGTAGTLILRAGGGLGINVGGNGGTGAKSGNIDVTSDATILTSGASSAGILAQAVGGGGGVGGMAREIDLQVGGSPATDTTRTGSISVGGTGGTGGTGGIVNVTNSGIIQTTGDASFGIFAESIGGGGGDGGATAVVRAQVSNRASDSFTIAVGGSGGTGGTGGAVTVLNDGYIFTQKDNSAGIGAESIGGGGGNGGLVLNVVLGGSGTPTSDKQSHNFELNIGGSGGIGGAGGTVSVTNKPVAGHANTGVIVTKGANSYGVFAQSIGGGGGNGSSVLSFTGLVAGKDSFSGGISIGGKGGSGNTGGTVTVDNQGIIDTTGSGAHGIFAQSVGGGGGNGGIAMAANILISKSALNTPLITIGGVGGDGGDGGAVTVSNSGTIVTRGANADGILAQSIGGGGGNANFGFSLTPEPGTLILSNSLALLVGAVGGGTGGTGGVVTVNHSGDITVLGDGSNAIVAQSINGGGGTLKLDFAGIVGLTGTPLGAGTPKPPAPKMSAVLGSSDTSLMNAGSVHINTTGTFGVAGANGIGAFEQSIGGGGGIAVMKTHIVPQQTNFDLTQLSIDWSLKLGGTNGNQNKGGAIDSTHAGSIITNGVNAPGALIQSIGGGGGRGVIDVTVDAGGQLGPITLAFGETNGLNDKGGDINYRQTGAIVTTADLASSAILQSIGGGGGDASVWLHGAGVTTHSAGSADMVPADMGTASNPAAVTVSLGASGGAGLDGGAVTPSYSGGFQTSGASALGPVLQSIGAGGGSARLLGVGSVDVTLGASGGASGNGGLVSLTNSGVVLTSGTRSHGILLQSIGGGGGAVLGDFTSANVTLSAGGVGNGGAISLNQTGDVITSGAQTYGLIAQSLGGGGGWVDGAFAGTAGGVGRGGAIDLHLSGRVLSTNTDSTAIFAQSLGSLGGGNITIASNGAIRGGSGSGIGLKIDGGLNNVVTSSGSISAVSAKAIVATSGNDTINNDGLVVGDVFLGSGANLFNNRAGSTFIAYHTIDLRDGAGSTGTFTNAGDFEMGLSAPKVPIDLLNGATFGNLDLVSDPRTNLLFGSRVINTVALDGDYVQTSAGHLAFDIAFGPYASDRVNVTGNATVAGTGDVILTWLENKNPVPLFATTGGGHGVDNGLQIKDTMAIDFGILANSTGVNLTINTNFGLPFLNKNGRSLGRHMDSAVQVGGSSGIGRLLALLGNMTVGQEAQYAAVFTELNPEPHLAPLHLQMDEANSFGGQLFSCAAPSATTLDSQCVWSQLDRSDEHSNSSFENFGTQRVSTDLRAGFQRPMRDTWSLAGAFGYVRAGDISVDQRRYNANGDGFMVGLGMQSRSQDGLSLGYSVSGGGIWLDTSRKVTVFTPGVGQANVSTNYAQARFDSAQLLTSGRFFAKPAMGLSVTGLHLNSFQEKGLDGLGIKTRGETQWIVAAEPSLALGANFSDPVSPVQTGFTFTVGGRFSSTDKLHAPFSLVGAGQGAAPADIFTYYDDGVWKVSADFTVAGGSRASLNFNYTGEYGGTAERKRYGMDFKFKF